MNPYQKKMTNVKPFQPTEIPKFSGSFDDLNANLMGAKQEGMLGEVEEQETEEIKPVNYKNKRANKMEESSIDRSGILKNMEELALQAEKRVKQTAEAETKPIEEPKSLEDIKRAQQDKMIRDTLGEKHEVLIAKWKKEYGERGIYAITLGEDDVYIFTYLRYGDWKSLVNNHSKMSQENPQYAEEKLRESVLKLCVLFPSLSSEKAIPFWREARAGVQDTLYQVITLHSYLLNPAQAMSMTVEL